MLFSLGYFYEHANKQFGNKPLKIVISKKVFIEIVKKSSITLKGERAIYKNLEVLEKKKYISYQGKVLRLTKKGDKKYVSMKKIMQPYLNMMNILSAKDLLKYVKRSQTVFE